MFLVAGLGNPGEEYAGTPHNLGFMVVDRLAGKKGIRVTRRDLEGLVGLGQIAGRDAMLAKPQTFMNPLALDRLKSRRTPVESFYLDLQLLDSFYTGHKYHHTASATMRSEERRVGKECRS